MRDPYSARGGALLPWLVSLLVAGFAVEFLFSRIDTTSSIVRSLALSPMSLRQGQVWSLLTYAFLHAGLLHLVFNVLGLYFLGRELEPMLGRARFGWLCAAAAVAGGLTWTATHFFTGGASVVGASAVVAALFVVFACFFPEREITFLVFFVLPVTLKPRVALWGMLVFELLGLVTGEVPGGSLNLGVAHSAHLGGMFAGWVYFRFFHAVHGWDRASTIEWQWPSWLKLRSRARDPLATPPAEGPTNRSSGDLKARVDRILDKINSQGFGALTPEEKRTLDEARELLSRK